MRLGLTSYSEIIDKFSLVDSYQDMPQSELCSYCYIEKYRVMQSSVYSVYQRDRFYRNRVWHTYATCPGASGPTAIRPLPIAQPPKEPLSCFTDSIYTAKAGDTCDSIAQRHSVSSAFLQMGNPDNCTDVTPGLDLCIPPTCDTLYILQANDTCLSIEIKQNRDLGTVKKYNSWIDY
jgi:hypothetical protein